MTESTLQAIDLALSNALWVFLGTFLLILLLIALQLRARSGETSGEETSDEERTLYRGLLRRRLFSLSEQLQKSFQGLLLSLFLALIAGLFLIFGPATPLRSSEETFPLRLTTLTFERFYEGFSLRGEIWNQTQDTLPGISAVVHILGPENEQLEEVVTAVEPDPLPARSPGTFQIRYARNSPFLRGYKVSFTSSGATLPHIKGFDVE